MPAKTITIPVQEYNRLKEAEKVDAELLAKLVRGFEDIKAGRIKKFI